MKKGKTDYDVPADVFVRTWQSSSSAQEVADKLKMPKPIVHARASMYRGAGIALKRMPRHQTEALDIKGLNAIVAEINKQMGEGGKVNAPPPSQRKKESLAVEADPRSVIASLLK